MLQGKVPCPRTTGFTGEVPDRASHVCMHIHVYVSKKQVHIAVMGSYSGRGRLSWSHLRACVTPQVFEEEHHVLYLDHGGVIAAIKDTSIPLKILK